MLHIDNVKKGYGQTPVLNGVSLHVASGEIYGLVGKNGAGKTTLMNIIAGITQASSGTCRIAGTFSSENALEKGIIGYLPDLPSFYDYLSVSEYISYLETDAKKHSINIEELITRFGVNPKAKIKNLSRGNKQKLGIIAAVMGSPKVLLLDEPVSALDPMGRHDVMQLINELKQAGMAVILSTHILADLEMVCDKIGFLNNGIIAREIQLKQTASCNRGYQIHFASESGTELLQIKKIFDGYEVKSLTDGVQIWCDTEQINQEDFFLKLSAVPYKIESLEKMGRINLEAIMEEVLKS